MAKNNNPKIIQDKFDADLMLLNELLQDQMYEESENSLYKFIINFWNTFEPSILRNNWHIGCIAEHIQAALDRQLRRIIVTVPPRCLEENTLIRMYDGTSKAIKDVKIEDEVLSYDITNRIHVPGRVTDVIDSGIQETYRLLLESGKEVIATDKHRFLSCSGYRQVRYLVAGDVISVKGITTEEKYEKIISVGYTGKRYVYDITVDTFSNFTLANGIHSHNSGKSIISSICFPVWSFLQKPHEKFWLISHSARLFVQNIVYARRIMEHPAYRDRWCNPQLKEHYKFSISSDVNTKTRVENTAGGYVLGGSPTSGALGMGYSIAVLDDIMDSEQANTPAAIESVNNWYTQTFLNRSNDVNNDVIFIIQQRLSSCFTPDTLVKTDSGLKEIQYLTYADRVYTSNHKYEEILDIKEKEVNPHIIEIKPIGIPLKLKVTPEHEVKILNKYGVDKWLQAKDISLSDRLVYPIRRKTKSIDVDDYWIKDEDIVRKNKGNRYAGTPSYSKSQPKISREELIDLFKQYKGHIQNVGEHLNLHRTTIMNYLSYYNLLSLANKNNYLSVDCVYTKEFWRVVGYWVAEGWLSGNLVSFAFHSEEVEYINFIANFCDKYNLKYSIKPSKVKKCTKIYFSSIQFSSFLRDNFRELAEHKCIPDWMFDLEDECIKEFLLGYIQGDGTIRKSKTSVTTVSRDLAEGVFNLFLRLGIPCYWTKTKKYLPNRLDSYDIFVHNYFVKDWIYKQDKHITEEYAKFPTTLHNYIDGDNFIVKIRKLEKVSNTDKVWDITTPTGDFVAEGVLVHNSDLVDYVMTTYGEQDWFLLNLPAKYEPERTFISPIGVNDQRTKKNQLLDPIRLPDDFLATQAKNKIIYNTRYQQNPYATGDGNVLKEEYIVERDTLPYNYTALITVWDLNITESPESDYTVGLVVGKHEEEYWILDMIRQQLDIPKQVDAILKLKHKYPKATIGIEARANGHAAMSLLRREVKDIYSIEPRLFGGDKISRFNAILPYFRDKQVIIYSPSPFRPDMSTRLEPEYDVEVIKKELKSFPLGKTDDIVDALSYAVQWLAEYAATSEGVITKGERIILTEEDMYNNRRRNSEYNIFNTAVNTPDDYYSGNNTPSRDDLTSIGW